MREKTQKRRCFAVYFDAQADILVANLSPSLRHAKPVRCRYKKRNGGAVIDVLTVKRKGF
ncbi:MAG: hypothetical protein WDM89_09010 [Rhizomicrobium sp.]